MPIATPTPSPAAIRGISSMATRAVLAELVAAYAQLGQAVSVEAVGGVDAARRVQAGEAFDLVVLAADAIDKLISAGAVRPGSRVDLVHSGVAAAVRTGARLPDLGSEASVRQAVLDAPSIGYSTGPSGVQLLQQFQRWGIADALQGRLVQAPPGVPVAGLVARGEVALGFQQLSELLGVDGITVVGPLPPAIQITTTFSAGLCTASPSAAEVQALVRFLRSPAAAEVCRRHGMTPA